MARPLRRYWLGQRNSDKSQTEQHGRSAMQIMRQEARHFHTPKAQVASLHRLKLSGQTSRHQFPNGVAMLLVVLTNAESSLKLVGLVSWPAIFLSRWPVGDQSRESH